MASPMFVLRNQYLIMRGQSLHDIVNSADLIRVRTQCEDSFVFDVLSDRLFVGAELLPILF